MRTRGQHTQGVLRIGKPYLSWLPGPKPRSEAPKFTSSPQAPVQWPTARDQHVLSRPWDSLSHPLNEALLCSERGHCILLSILKIFECRKLGDVESFCQGLVDGGIDSCKDTRALGRGRGQPCMTASDTVPAGEEPGRQPPPTLGLSEPHRAGTPYIPGTPGHWHQSHLWPEMKPFYRPHQPGGADCSCSQQARSHRKRTMGLHPRPHDLGRGHLDGYLQVHSSEPDPIVSEHCSTPGRSPTCLTKTHLLRDREILQDSMELRSCY